MALDNLLLFGLAVFPLVCTPGPDVLFIASQGLTSGRRAVIIANSGILTGYCVHAVLSALGVAALVAASPLLFNLIRWVGVAYLLYLAGVMIHSALKKSLHHIQQGANVKQQHLFRKGFFTSFLNPKGLLIYLAILPNFIRPENSYALQALMLAGVFIVSCAIVYTIIGVSLASLGGKAQSEGRRRLVEGCSGSMLLIAAGFIAIS